MFAPEPIRIGALHSTSGTMALAETSLRDVLLMEAARVNAAGGVLGRPVEVITRNPGSDWMAYRDMAHELIRDHEVAALFGCWTSISRKSVLPVVEDADRLLFYPMQYEGEEQSRNIFYFGATPNQQAIPALEYMMSPAGGAFSRFFFIGTDYVYPRTTNRVLKSFLDATGLAAGNFPEYYVPFGHSDWSGEIAALREFYAQGRGVIISTINGESNLSFYHAIREAGLPAEELPIMAFSVSEAELQALAPEDVAGHYACWGYFMSHPSAENAAFIAAWRDYAKDQRPIYQPMESTAIGFRMWCKAVTEAGTTATKPVRQFMYGQTETALCGGRYLMDVNHHVDMRVFIGRATTERQFEVVWEAPRPIPGDPWAAATIIADTRAANAQRDLLEALPTPLIVLDAHGEARYRSASTHKYFGSTIGKVSLAAIQEVARRLESEIDSGEQSDEHLHEITVRNPHGRTHYMTVAVRRMVFGGGDAHILSLADVTHIRRIENELREANERLQHLATTDSLTEVSNRRHFLQQAQDEMQRMRRHRRPAAMFMLDLDHFKALNDRHGHDAGDKVLIEASSRIRQLLRGHDLFGRMGGEEFAGLLPETDITAAFAVAQRVRESIAAIRLKIGNDTVTVTCSIGMSAVIAETDTPESALKRADAALYNAKQAGRNRVLIG
jgi:urea transport system substrate-binding protein